MKEKKFEQVSDEELERVSGGRRRTSSWQKDIGEFLNGFLHGWMVIPNKKKGSN
ncbi:bacteriocin [Lactobacillus sp. LL6]|uniref:bacteriocin n=1 Tax=Lactobacillus sp. LL6 TaxID=2596827 RepID=UPI00118666F0|nr:bacteriocin [Lactobacillus sp. LL6]TSO25767.1 bacteriocin [Lactobacillus sp. LL6]